MTENKGANTAEESAGSIVSDMPGPEISEKTYANVVNELRGRRRKGRKKPCGCRYRIEDGVEKITRPCKKHR